MEEKPLTLSNQPTKKQTKQTKQHHHPQNKTKTKQNKTPKQQQQKNSLSLIIVKICPGFFSQKQDIGVKYLDRDSLKEPW